ncbi:hypothetical protein KBC03_00775 [Patescibacteria group bacterium]|nr:hypothetical protein [Patescibacteria group bacterium]
MPDLDKQGRIVVLEYEEFILINTYIPNGGPANAKVGIKLDYLHKIFELVSGLMKKKEVIFCGDFNIAHTPNDLAQPKQNARRTGFLPEERVMIDKLIAMGFADVLRIFHPEAPIYSWYSYRSKNT